MLNRKELAAIAVAKALQLRKKLGVPLEDSISAIDAAERLGIEVRLVTLPSLEGIYVAGSAPQIILSSLRPQGRRNFTCAHEIGHHIFGHGEQFDELTDERSALRRNNPKEFSADCFAAFFLMPRSTIDCAMQRRKLSYDSLNPLNTYAVASWLGVGYSTLVNHLDYGIHAITSRKAQELRDLEPRDIRKLLLGWPVPSHLHVADEHWVGRAIDSEVGDYLLLPNETRAEGPQLNILDKNIALAQTKSPGIARVTNDSIGWAAFVRVSRKEFVGRGCYRFEEEIKEL